MSKTVLVTGASSGFGFITVQSLLDAGHTAIAAMRGLNGKNKEQAQKLTDYAEGKPGTLHLVEMDVTDDNSVQQSATQVIEKAGPPDVVINNAGMGVAGMAESITADDWQKQLNVNVVGVQRVNRAFLPAMRERGDGLIIFVSSVMGRIVLPFASAYTASKWALEGMAESYRYELAPTGIDVVIVEPGGFPTNFFGNMQNGSDAERLESYGEYKSMPEQFWGGVGQAIQSDEAPDPKVVVDEIMEAIAAPAGQRPLRIVVDPMSGGEGAKALNKAQDEIQNAMLNAMQMDTLLNLKTKANA